MKLKTKLLSGFLAAAMTLSQMPAFAEAATVSEARLAEISAMKSAEVSALVPEIMKDAVAMYVGKGNVLLHGEKSYISENEFTTPKWQDGEVIVPVRFFANTIDADVFYDATEKKCTVKSYYNELSFWANSIEYEINGTKKQMKTKAVILKDGSMYAPIEVLCSVFDKKLHIEENGIIIYSDGDMSHILDWSKNLKLMRAISESYMFDDVTGSELVNKMTERYPNQAHPRLMMTEQDFARIRESLADENGDEVYKTLFKKLKNIAESYMTQKTSGYEIRDGIRLLAVCRENKERMLLLSFMYNLTGEERYAERAYLEMYTSACFVDWNPYHFLDVGEMTAAMGLSYDWLYNWMTPEQRKPIREAIVQNGIKPIIEDFDDVERKRSWNWRGELADNWCFVISGVGVGALAVADELVGQDRIDAERAAEQTLLDIRRALSLFAPHGGYEEGINYWGLTMEFFVYHMKSFLTAIGDDFGYIDVPGMRNTNQYIFSMNGSVNAFAYHDTGEKASFVPAQTMFLADYFGEYGEAKPRIEKILKEGMASVVDMILYRPEFLEAEESENPLDSYMPIAETVTMRSGWEKTDTYVGFHCDDPYGSAGHDHNDSGQFVLDAMGENFFFDLGQESYNLQPYRDTYKFRAEGHSTIVFGPSHDQKFGGKANIEEYSFGETGGYVIGNMTGAYADDISESIRRGVRLDNFRRTVTVQDEIRLKKETDFYWFGHTKATIEISEDKKSAVLTRNGKKLLATIEKGDGAEFSVMNATPLPTSPVVEGQGKNNNIRKLTVHMEKVKDLDLCITFVNYDETYDPANYVYEYKPLDSWQTPAGKMSDLQHATVNSITVNGKLIDGFTPEVTEYEVPVTSLDMAADKVEVTADGEYEIIEREVVSGKTYIVAKRNGDKERNIYTIKFTVPPELIPEGERVEVVPVNVMASGVPQPENNPENTLDNNLGTRWSCEGVCYIQYDLGKVYSLDTVAVAFMEGDIRTAQFGIDLSVDGVNFKTLFEGDSQSTLELEEHAMLGERARYVRINCYGYNNKRSNWNSVTEVKTYAGGSSAG